MSDKPHSLDCSYSNWQAAVRRAEKAEARLAEVEKERGAWSARCLTAEQDLAIAGVRGSPPLGGQEPTIPRLRRERDAAQARARKLEAALREYHPEPHDSPPRPNCPACKLLTPPALPPSDDTSYDAVALPQVPPALPLCSRCGKPNVDRGRIADTVIYGCDCTTYQRFEPRAAHEPPAGGEPKP